MTKVEDAAGKLRGRYVESLPAKRKVVEAALEALRSGSVPRAEAEDTLRRLAHQIRGAAASYGFPRIDDAAHRLEQADEPARALAAAEALVSELFQAQALAAESSLPTRILLIDDDPEIGAIVDALLADENILLIQSTTGVAARRELDAGEWDLIFVDLILPDSDGRTLLPEIRAYPAQRDTPLIVLSSKTGSLVKSECSMYGIDAFIEKPIDPATFAVAITSVLTRARSLRPSPEGRAPWAGDAHDDERSARALDADAKLPTILIAEDDPDIAALLRHDLIEDFEVTHVANGDAAVAAALDTRFDAVLLDYQMPGRDGVEVVRALRQRPQYDGIPILLLTAVGSDAAVEAAFAAGADDYISKPHSARSLRARLSRHLGRSQRQSGTDAPLEVDETVVTALFCDISGFTEIAASMAPREVVVLLKSYFPVVADIVARHDGILEKYIGDAILAVWGTPTRHDDDALRALRAAVDIQHAVAELARGGSRPLRVHIGLNSGPVAATNFGSRDLSQYATIGAATNLASRVCDIAAPGEIALGATTIEMLDGASAWPIDGPFSHTVKGRDQPISIYKVRWEQV